MTRLGAVRRMLRLSTAVLTAGLVVAAASPAALASTSGSAASASGAATGWVRLAHLSPGASAVDISLYAIGSSHSIVTLKDVSYGMVSNYQAVTPGEYTIAERKTGSPATATPLLSTTLMVGAGRSYTIAAVGPAASPRLQVLDDMRSTPKGKALLRVIQASLLQHRVTVTVSGRPLVRNLAFGTATSYQALPPGPLRLKVAGATMRASDTDDTLTAGSSYTVVVLDQSGHLTLDCLTDAVASKATPEGSAATGFGGTAPRPAPSRIPWLGGVAAGLALAAGGALWLRRRLRTGTLGRA